MSRVFFRAGKTVLELKGSEPFVNRQLVSLAEFLPHVEPSALAGALEPRGFAVTESAAAVRPAEPAPAAPEASGRPSRVADLKASPSTAYSAPVHGSGADRIGEGAPESLEAFFKKHEPADQNRQADSALLFAYYMQLREGAGSLELGDLLRCCARVGVDTRNFNRTLGQLTRRGLLETVRHGHAYRLSQHGVAAVEQQLA